MLPYKGKYGEAKVWIDSIDPATTKQIYEFLNHPAFTKPIAVMPDTHKGNGVVIGFTMEMTDKVIPNVIGVDIGCNMLSMDMGPGVNLFTQISRADLDYLIRQAVPFGTNVRKEAIKVDWKSAAYGMTVMSYYLNKKYNIMNPGQPIKAGDGKMPPEMNTQVRCLKWIEKKCEQVGMDFDRAMKSLGTLGGGNHFIEIGESEKTGNPIITVHTGSRQFGQKIAIYWQRVARKFCKEHGLSNVRGDLAYLEGENMYDYLMDMAFAQFYASQNSILIAREIIKILMIDPVKWYSTVHNYVDPEDMIIRKGAIASYKNRGEMIIPFSMEDGLLICKGKSNREWNYSAPHGCGRVDSRRWAKENLSLDEARGRMAEKDIYCSKLPLDETKLAYKDPEIIEKSIADTAEIVDRVKPVMAMKD
jgi:RNA-splicing ligase RtcB